jgi:hypothetical protein
MSRVSSLTSQTEVSSLHSADDSIEEGTDIDTGLDVETEAEESLVPPIADSVREVYLISDEDAREHEDAVELVNWSTFDDWKQPWHVVKLWEGSVYDEMTLWGSIPLQNDKLRKVCFVCFGFDRRWFLIKCVNIPNDFDNIGFGILMLFH